MCLFHVALTKRNYLQGLCLCVVVHSVQLYIYYPSISIPLSPRALVVTTWCCMELRLLCGHSFDVFSMCGVSEAC